MKYINILTCVLYCECRDEGDGVNRSDMDSLNERIRLRKKKLKNAEVVGSDMTLLNGDDVLDYFLLVQDKGTSTLRPMCDLFLGILPFIPTSVLCERSFSVYNGIMRSDRTSMSNEVVDACVILNSYNLVPVFDVNDINHDINAGRRVPMKVFNLHEHRHLFPFLNHHHGTEQERLRTLNELRTVCRRRFIYLLYYQN